MAFLMDLHHLVEPGGRGGGAVVVLSRLFVCEFQAESPRPHLAPMLAIG